MATATRKKADTQPQAEEITQELVNKTKIARRIRVYKNSGDFFLELPPGCRCTFGYFNPTAAGMGGGDVRYGQGMGRGMETMKTTALRIYQGTGDKMQLACFLGVNGFRDETIKLTKIVERVTIERRLSDDGEGTVEFGGREARELVAAPEKEFPEDSVF